MSDSFLASPISGGSSGHPYFFLAPGIGLGLLSDSGLELVSVFDNLAEIQKIAVLLSQVSSGISPDPNHPLHKTLTAVHSRWLELGGKVISSTPGSRQFNATMPTISFIGMHRMPLGFEPVDSEILLNTALDSLRDRGYELKLRTPSEQTSLLPGSDVIPVHEICTQSSPNGVIAEGKGLTQSRSRASAIGEAVERVVGDYPFDTSKILTASQSELGPDAVDVASLGLGPRDMLNNELCSDWIQAYYIDGQPILIPAELVYTSYVSRTGVVAIAHRNTTGLAAGSTMGQAFLNGLLEAIERDAYWIVMRCRLNCPDIDIDDVQGLGPEVVALIERYRSAGFRLHLKNISLDWPVQVVHALLEDRHGRVPAFAHGTGAALDMRTALARAVCEVGQVHSDLRKVVAHDIANYLLPEERPRSPSLSWADPLWRPHIAHLMKNETQGADFHTSFESTLECVAGTDFLLHERVTTLLGDLTALGYKVIWCPLDQIGGIQVVRVIVLGATHPDPRLERISARLLRYSEGNSGLFGDPILT